MPPLCSQMQPTSSQIHPPGVKYHPLASPVANHPAAICTVYCNTAEDSKHSHTDTKQHPKCSNASMQLWKEDYGGRRQGR